MSPKTQEDFNFAGLSLAGAPLIKVTPPGPESQRYLSYQARHESSVVSYSRGMPMALKRGRGATLEDVDGNIYIDCFSGAGVMAVGHANPEVLEAAQRQINDLTHALDIPNPARQSLDEVLFELLPPELSRVFFGGPTGSDAVEQALKLARFNSGRIPMVAFEGSYHGMTAGALAITSAGSHKEGLLPMIPEVHFAPYAYCYRCPFGKSQGRCAMECTQYLDHLLADPHSGVCQPAAVIVEPIQGEGGSVVPPVEFLQGVRRVCDKHDVILICDEVQCGLGRTGRMFAFQHSGITPDIVTMSKALGGLGFPISAIAYREKLNTMPPGKSIGTFRGNLIAYAAGAAALKFMTEKHVPEHATSLGEKALGWLKEIEKGSSIVGEVRGKGLMIGVEFVKDKTTKEPSMEFAKKARTLCHQRGVMIEVGGHFDNVARLLPPLVITEELLRKALDIFAQVVRDIEKTRA